jgi:DNA helicase-2/ATP-dependent DNA helicase PcrA
LETSPRGDDATGNAQEIDEQRARLLYVAMTRAKQLLQLVAPQRLYLHQQAATVIGMCTSR